MTIRKLTYSIDFFHILTFKEHYRSIIGPYFSYEPLQYAIENENTLNESIRLIFRNEGFVMFFRKEGMALVYEGDVSEIKKSNPITDIYFDIYEKIKGMEGYTKTKRHKIVLDCVEIKDNEYLEPKLTTNDFLKNPFGKLSEFATIFEFEKDSKKIRFQFGNFSDKDIKQYDLSPLKTEFNKELSGKVGLMCQANISEELSSSSFSKFKSILKEGEDLINLYVSDLA